MHHVCAWVGVGGGGCMCGGVYVSVSCRFFQNYYSYRFFVNSVKNFHALEIFGGFMDLGLKISG